MNIFRYAVHGSLGLMLAVLVVACSPADDKRSPKADMVINAAKIYTVDENNPIASSVAIKDGRIIYVGSSDGAIAYVNDDTEMVDLDDGIMYPGFTDGHGHLMGIGQREMTLNLEGSASIVEVRERVSAALVGMESGKVLIGRGWIETHWPEARFLNKNDLDDLSPNNPVVLTRADGHALAANSMALAMAGVDKDTVSAEGGEIHRLPNGEPNGVIVDDDQAAFYEILGSFSDDQKQEAYIKAGEVYNAYGWTGIHAMSVDPNNISLVESLSDSGDVNLRVYNSIDMKNDGGVVNASAINRLINEGSRQSRNGRVVTRAIKLYMDGALGSRGAALLAPYSDSPESVGLMRSTKADVMPILEGALRAGIQINTHAIGDRGNRVLLNWYEQAFATVPKSERTIAEPRWRDEHSQIINPDDIPRFVDLGIIPSMQPSHAIGDLFFAPSRLGSERLNGAYAWQTLLNTGSIVLGGTDAPVERGDPRIEFYAAVARMSLDGFSDENWHKEEAVSRENALKMFTLWPAFGSFMENDLGSIEVGKLADLTVFSVDIMTIPPEEILTAPVVMTIVEGEIVYSAAVD